MPKRKGSSPSSKPEAVVLRELESASSYVPMHTQHHVPKKQPPLKQIIIAATVVLVILLVFLLVVVFRVGMP
ncbi:MAG TPA: hypothetical protein DEB24_00535 [Coriobacteriia bacterium]|nr:hypothetical protein [Coriobacteriia bacterium]